MKKVGVLMFAFVFLFCLSALPVMAADKELEQLKGEVQKLLNKIQGLEKKQQESEKKFESVEKAATQLEQEEAKLKEEKKQKAIAYWRDGFFIETPDKKFRLQIGGVLHFDTRAFGGGTDTPSSFDIRRARYDMRGSMYTGDIEHVFRLQLEMADSPLLRNAYWMFKFRPEFNLMVGQFKIPSGGADWLTEEAQVNFIEYATDTPVSPFFDRGFNIISKFFNDKVQTCLSMVNGSGMDVDQTIGDLDNSKNYIARLLLVPFKDTNISWLKGMHFAGSYEDGLQSIKTVRGEANNRTENFESQWFRWTQGLVNIDDRKRYGAEVHWIWGPFTASYEFNRVQWENISVFKEVYSTIPVVGKSLASTKRVFYFNLPGDHHVDVNQIWVSYFLTGEQKTFDDVFFAWRQPKPKKNFSLKDGTWGAWEIMARYSTKEASEDLFERQIANDSKSVILDGSQEGYSLTGGLRWIWNPKVRIMFDVNYLKSDEGSGIVTTSAHIGAFDKRKYQQNETGYLLRFIMTL